MSKAKFDPRTFINENAITLSEKVRKMNRVQRKQLIKESLSMTSTNCSWQSYQLRLAIIEFASTYNYNHK